MAGPAPSRSAAEQLLRTPGAERSSTDWAEAHLADVVASRADYDAARD